MDDHYIGPLRCPRSAFLLFQRHVSSLAHPGIATRKHLNPCKILRKHRFHLDFGVESPKTKSLIGIEMSVELRELLESDYSEVRRLWESTEGVGLSEGDSQEGVTQLIIRNPGLSWVAVVGERVIGSILCGHDGRRGMIYHLSVATGYRRHGVGTRLVRAVFNGLRTEGIEQCYAMVYTSNAAAHEFWKRAGGVARTDLNLFRIPVSSL